MAPTPEPDDLLTLRASTGNTYLLTPSIRAHWGRDVAGPRETVQLKVRTQCAPARGEVALSIWVRSDSEEPRLLEGGIRVSLESGAATLDWDVQDVDHLEGQETAIEPGWIENEDDPRVTDGAPCPWQPPVLVFRVAYAGTEAESPPLRYRRDLRVEVDLDDAGPADGNAILLFADGTQREGSVRQGVLEVEDVPPFPFLLHVEGCTDV